ncbi:hypothetical protein ACEN2P_00890 [Pedobacter psychrotolerans]|uniref:hypothetical protein n=1 Tax=Pedobacter psychrotolerans TaxID=1843235 RepID=UPI003F980382
MQVVKTKSIKSKKQFETALALEKSGDHSAALKRYEQAVSTDPANTAAWNRQMILFRRLKTKLQEAQLIKKAIIAYQKATDAHMQEWINANKDKADHTRELATMLGQLEPSGMPKRDHHILERWQTRLYLLEYRLKNAKKKITPAQKPIEKKKINKSQPSAKPSKKHTPAKQKSRNLKASSNK